MLKVGDFSQLGQVSVRTLHHYDERGLLKPVEIDPTSNYRFYSLDQLPRLNRILALKDLGLSLDEISLLMEDELPPDQLRGLLKVRRAKIESQLREDRTRLAHVEARLRQIEHEDEPSPYEVTLKEVRPETVISERRTVPTVDRMPDYRCDMFQKTHDWLEHNRLRPAGPELALYHSTEYVDENIDMEAAVPVTRPDLEPGDGLFIRELPGAADMATTVHHGSFWGIPGAIRPVRLARGQRLPVGRAGKGDPPLRPRERRGPRPAHSPLPRRLRHYGDASAGARDSCLKTFYKSQKDLQFLLDPHAT